MKKDMNSDRSEDARVSWRELYSYWNLAIKKFPQLGSETSCLKVDITEPAPSITLTGFPKRRPKRQSKRI